MAYISQKKVQHRKQLQIWCTLAVLFILILIIIGVVIYFVIYHGKISGKTDQSSGNDTQTQLCIPNPCQNGGFCTCNNATNCMCSCSDDFDGDLCENSIVVTKIETTAIKTDPPTNPPTVPPTETPISKECTENLCQNGAACTKDGTAEVCECLKYYDGKYCESIKSNYALVQTQLGLLQGSVITSQTGAEVKEFLGVPYAAPPLDNLRLANPESIDTFPQDPYEATDVQAACWGYVDNAFGDFAGSNMWNPKNPITEDCLYMNIWVPKSSSEKKLSVMVWIFGGGFYSGSNSLYLYNGSTLATHGDVIVVAINYRVGSLGFLSTGDGRVAGNFGLKDQQLAIKWIHGNIEDFGGDPDAITLFGESAGAASVGYHFFLQESKDNFHRAIFQSGSPIASWAYMSPQKATERSKSFFSNINCPNDDNILACLRSKSAKDLSDNDWVTPHFMQFPWVPTYEQNFIDDTPENYFKNENFARKDSIIGYNKDEGTFWLLYSIPGLSKEDSSPLNKTQYLNGVDIISWELNDDQKNSLLKNYSHDYSNKALNRDTLDDICGDARFICPSIELIDTFSLSGANIYTFNLGYLASNEAWPSWMGVIHGADIQWIFGLPLDEQYEFNEMEKELSKNIMTYWSNFAKSGSPNGPSGSDLPAWAVYEKSAPSYLLIGEDGSISRESSVLPRTDICSKFWLTI